MDSHSSSAARARKERHGRSPTPPRTGRHSTRVPLVPHRPPAARVRRPAAPHATPTNRALAANGLQPGRAHDGRRRGEWQQQRRRRRVQAAQHPAHGRRGLHRQPRRAATHSAAPRVQGVRALASACSRAGVCATRSRRRSADSATLNPVRAAPAFAPRTQVVVYDSLEYCASMNNLSAVRNAPNFKVRVSRRRIGSRWR